MGEYADIIIEGGMCEWCGVFLKGSPGYPRLCADCAEGLPEEQWRVAEELGGERWCRCCGSDDVQNYRCNRCGAELHEDGAVSYNPEEVKDNIEYYDNLRREM